MSTESITRLGDNVSDEEKHSSSPLRASQTNMARAEEEEIHQIAGQKGTTNQIHEAPHDIVDWDGPDDPANPLCWSNKKKWLNIGIISIISTITPLAAAILAPSIPQFLIGLSTPTNLTVGAFAVSVYTLGFAIGPLLLSPLSELYGRLPIYHTCGILYVLFTVGGALSNSLKMLIGFRFLAGCAGSAPLTIGGGSMADMMVPEKRGAAMSIQAFGGMMGPAIGPVAGAFLGEARGWRWVLWLVAILSGTTTLLAILLLRETYAPTLLARKAHRLNKISTTTTSNHPPLRSALARSDLTVPRAIRTAIIRPVKMLLLSPLVFLFSLLMGLSYGLMYLLYTTISIIYTSTYHFSIGLSGVAYLGAGIGTFIGLGIIMYYSDRIAVKKAKGGKIEPEMRLPPLIWGYLPFPAGLMIFGWAAQEHVAWIVPVLANGLTGIGVIFVYLPVQIYLVDCYPRYAASSLAAVSFFRSVLGATLPLAGNGLEKSLGLGVGYTILAAVALAFWPVGLVAYIWGKRLRARFVLNL